MFKIYNFNSEGKTTLERPRRR